MAFPFYKSIDSYIVNELKARTVDNNVKLSKLVPWVKATSSLEGRYTIGTDSYFTLFDGTSASYGNSGTNWKYRPNPIVTDFSVDFASRGTLRRCTLKIKCFSPEQLKLIQENFMEPGISVFVQWGWNYSVAKNKTIGPLDTSADVVQLYNRDAQELNKVRETNEGCYDNFVGIIGGGESSISGNAFEVTVKMVSLGEILMGKSNETVIPEVESDDNKTKSNSHPKYVLRGSLIADRKPLLNWVEFFQQLPDELRIKKTLNLEDGDATVAAIKPESDFINYIPELSEEAKYETTDTGFGGAAGITFKGKTFIARDSESPITDKKFVSFDAFIKLLNSSRIQYQPNAAVNFNIDIKDAYCGAFLGMFSTSERVIIPNRFTYNYLNDIPLLGGGFTGFLDTSINGRSFVKTTPTNITIEGSTATLVGYRHGWIGDLYIDNELAMEALKDQTTSIKEILDNVLKEMENAVEGLWAFQIVESSNGSNNSLRITDANLRNLRTSNTGATPPEFEMFGVNSFFLDASFNLDIPKEMASKVYMEKSADGVQSTNELTSGIFSSKKDVVLPKLQKVEESADSQQISQPTVTEALLLQWIELRRNIKFITNPKIINQLDIGNANMDEWAICAQYLNKRKFNDIKKQYLGYSTPNAEVYNGRSLPVGFDFTILGMSGFQVGHMFNVKGLPEQYNSNRGAFQVEEITHKIDSKQWISEVKSHFRPFYK